MNSPDQFESAEKVNSYLDHLTYDTTGVPDYRVPPILMNGEDVLVPRSVKIPLRLDSALGKIAAQRGVTKSELVRQYLETSAAAELAADPQDDVMIPLGEALKALAGLRQLPRTA